VLVVASRQTLGQRFILEVASRLPNGAAEGVIRAAYDAEEELRPPTVELEAYYNLCDRATGWSAAGLRRIGLVDYATLLGQAHGRGLDGATAAEQTLRTVRWILDREPVAETADETFLRAARKTASETRKALGVAGRLRDPSAERQTLHLGTAAASRAFVAGWGFFGGAPAEARATVAAMRA
jgi:hypothetical protein